MDFWSEHWWLIFPIAAFVFAGWERYLSYRHSRDRLDLMKDYAAKGKEPPAELSRAYDADIDGRGWGYGYGPFGWRGRHWRQGPYWEWRRVVVFGAIAVGFFAASRSTHTGAEDAFLLVSIITGAMAVGSLIFAVLATTFRGDK